MCVEEGGGLNRLDIIKEPLCRINTREITHPDDNANDTLKRSSPIVLRSTLWGYPAISHALKSVTHMIMCAAFSMGECHNVTLWGYCF